MNSLLLLFLALPLFVQGRGHRNHDSRANEELGEQVLVGDDAFSGQYQPIDPPRRPTYPSPAYHPPYGAPSSGAYNLQGYETPVNNGPSYGGNQYQAPAQQYPADNSPSYPAQAAQPYSGPY